MKKYLFYLLCMVITTSVCAQTKVGETFETKFDRAQSQLRQERASKQIAQDSIHELKNTLQNLQHDYDSIEVKLTEVSSALQNAQLTIQSQGSEAAKKLTESYEAKLNALETEKINVQNELSKTKQGLNEAVQKNNKLTATITEVQRTFPFIVTDIQFQNIDKKGNIINNYNERLFGKKINWLITKIDYNSLVDVSKDIAIRIKIFKPDGSLLKNPKVSTIYSTNTLYINASPGNRYVIINPWVNKGNSVFPSDKFKAGEYRVEVWYDDVCLGQKTFYIN